MQTDVELEMTSAFPLSKLERYGQHVVRVDVLTTYIQSICANFCLVLPCGDLSLRNKNTSPNVSPDIGTFKSGSLVRKDVAVMLR